VSEWDRRGLHGRHPDLSITLVGILRILVGQPLDSCTGSLTNVALDGVVGPNGNRSLAHRNQPKALRLRASCKSLPIIMNLKTELCAGIGAVNVYMRGVAMFCDIIQCLLHDAIQSDVGIGWKIELLSAFLVDVDCEFLTTKHSTAEIVHQRHKWRLNDPLWTEFKEKRLQFCQRRSI
jgi:hypothetical protein